MDLSKNLFEVSYKFKGTIIIMGQEPPRCQFVYGSSRGELTSFWTQTSECDPAVQK